MAAKDAPIMEHIPECDCGDCCVVRELNEALAAVQGFEMTIDEQTDVEKRRVRSPARESDNFTKNDVKAAVIRVRKSKTCKDCGIEVNSINLAATKDGESICIGCFYKSSTALKGE